MNGRLIKKNDTTMRQYGNYMAFEDEITIEMAGLAIQLLTKQAVEVMRGLGEIPDEICFFIKKEKETMPIGEGMQYETGFHHRAIGYEFLLPTRE